ncbi:hypothetical protein D8674_040770 [Pyrus ussuriensis x Pyrus communis]|uniref:Uncharacterized protein n=1 Tax=Pyrus ussuriensis x Pyrus communis TaxID=2448454 RepID=A0A5N5GHK9_9ROSA|nr:hypothetical protein D8674_040770 [Pyrus ussuriensis x Pyrus communis]
MDSIYCSRSNTAEVDALKEEVTTLKGAYVGHVRDLVRAIQMIGIQISLPVPDLAPPSTFEPLHLEDYL